jgi:hypothetical protein
MARPVAGGAGHPAVCLLVFATGGGTDDRFLERPDPHPPHPGVLGPGRPEHAGPTGSRRAAILKYARRHLDDREKQRRWIDPRLYHVKAADLQAYLLHKGWVPVPPDRPGFLVFQEPTTGETGPLYQFVPLDEGWEGYPAQEYELIAALALIEDRFAGDVLTDILKHSAAGASSANGPAVPATAEPASR